MSERLSLLTDAELVEKVCERVREGWVLLDADSELLPEIEYGIYPPGRKENEGFEIVLIPAYLGFSHIAVVRRTPKLRDILAKTTYGEPMSDWEWSNLVILKMERLDSESAMRVNVMVLKPGWTRKKWVDDRLRGKLTKLLSEAHKGRVDPQAVFTDVVEEMVRQGGGIAR